MKHAQHHHLKMQAAQAVELALERYDDAKIPVLDSDKSRLAEMHEALINSAAITLSMAADLQRRMSRLDLLPSRSAKGPAGGPIFAFSSAPRGEVSDSSLEGSLRVIAQKIISAYGSDHPDEPSQPEATLPFVILNWSKMTNAIGFDTELVAQLVDNGEFQLEAEFETAGENDPAGIVPSFLEARLHLLLNSESVPEGFNWHSLSYRKVALRIMRVESKGNESKEQK